MTLGGNHLSAYITDYNGSLLDNSATAEGAGAYWCVVGDETAISSTTAQQALTRCSVL